MLVACGRRVAVRNVGGVGVELQLSSKAPEVLLCKWLESNEEETNDGVMVFRPQNFPFPPNKKRLKVEFLKEGTILLWPDSTDDGFKGKWIYGQKTQTLEITFDKIQVKPLPKTIAERDGFLFNIIVLENGLLKVKQQAMPEKEKLNNGKN